MLKFVGILTALILSFCLNSCAQKLEDINEDFNAKFGGQVGVINAARTPPTVDPNAPKEVMYSRAPTPEQVMLDTSDSYYPYVDIAKFGEKQPQVYLPNAEFYGQARGNNPSNTLPPDIFVISYKTPLSPPFRRIGAEFDTIRIPPYDVYGVKTAMSDKTYLLPGGQAMQKAVDLIDDQKARNDDEISSILVNEKKQIIRKKKAVTMLGEQVDYNTGEVVEKKEKTPSSNNTAKKIENVKAGDSPLNQVSGFSIKNF